MRKIDGEGSVEVLEVDPGFTSSVPNSSMHRMKAEVNEKRVKLMLVYLGKLAFMKSSLGSFNGVDIGGRIKNVCDSIEKELDIKKRSEEQ